VIAIVVILKLLAQLLNLSLGLLALHTLSLSKQAPHMIPLSSTVEATFPGIRGRLTGMFSHLR
jgi:hypothetical protein